MYRQSALRFFFFFNDTATTEIYTLSLHDALPICDEAPGQAAHGLAQHHADDGVAEPAGHARDAERRVEEPGVRRVTPLEVLAQVADEIAVAVEGGEHVDETEELELGLLVSERPREERGGPAVGRIERLAVGGDAIKDLAADFLHARLAGPDAHDHLSLTPYPCHTDRKSTRLNSSHGYISYAVFCLKKKKQTHDTLRHM